MAEAVRISLASGVLCKHTAFVAVEEREEATEGTMQVRKIPITFEKGNYPHLSLRSHGTELIDRCGDVLSQLHRSESLHRRLHSSILLIPRTVRVSSCC